MIMSSWQQSNQIDLTRTSDVYQHQSHCFQWAIYCINLHHHKPSHLDGRHDTQSCIQPRTLQTEMSISDQVSHKYPDNCYHSFVSRVGPTVSQFHHLWYYGSMEKLHLSPIGKLHQIRTLLLHEYPMCSGEPKSLPMFLAVILYVYIHIITYSYCHNFTFMYNCDPAEPQFCHQPNSCILTWD